jgi:hypothetical protein
MKWYEYNNIERKKVVYDKYSTADFWNWWSDGEEAFMEVRIMKDYKEIKKFAQSVKLPFSSSGIYVKSAHELSFVINKFKDTHTIWFGINPKRQVINPRGWKTFSGKDIGIDKIKYLFIDIDRVTKEGAASTKDLLSADFLAEKILEELRKNNFAENYCKICSANGLQLLIKLDEPIVMPPLVLNDAGQYASTTILDQYKKIIKNGIGKVLCKFSKKFRDDYNVEVDATGFNMGRVGALPGSFNFKHDLKVPRGVIELHDGKNIGFADYLMDIFKSKKAKTTTQNQYINKSTDVMLKEYNLDIAEAKKNIIVHLMIDYSFPDGGINNTLWYALKILLHNQGICRDTEHYNALHKLLQDKHDRTFPDNGLEAEYLNNFNGTFKQNNLDMVPTIVNKYLRCHKIVRDSDKKELYLKPIFPVSPNGKSKAKIQIPIDPKLFKYDKTEAYELTEDTNDFLFDVKKLGKELLYRELSIQQASTIEMIFSSNAERQIVINFLHSFRSKWGDNTTIYMMKYYLDDFINYKRW